MNLPSLPVNLKIAKSGDIARLGTFGAPAGAVLVCAIVLILVVWPKMSQALKIRATNAEFSSRIAAFSTKLSILSSLDEKQLESQLGSAEQILPSDKAVFSFVRQIEAASSKNGVILDKVDVAPGILSGADSEIAVPSAGVVVEAAPKIQVKISIQSDYRAFLSFFRDLYSVPRVIGIRDLSISSGTGENGNILSSSFVVDAYWKSLPTELGSIESPVVDLTSEEKKMLESVKAVEVASGATSSAVPAVPTGRSDLFAPF